MGASPAPSSSLDPLPASPPVTLIPLLSCLWNPRGDSSAFPSGWTLLSLTLGPTCIPTEECYSAEVESWTTGEQFAGWILQSRCGGLELGGGWPALLIVPSSP